MAITMRYSLFLVIAMLICSLSYGDDRKPIRLEPLVFETKAPISKVIWHNIEGRGGFHAIVFEDNSGSSVTVRLAMQDRWDGESIRLSAMVYIADASPFGDIRLDWVGQCTYEDKDDVSYVPWSVNIKDEDWPVKTHDGIMKGEMSPHSQYDFAMIETNGDIPLNGCEKYDAHKLRILWLKASVDAVDTTVVRPNNFLFTMFMADYGVIEKKSE